LGLRRLGHAVSLEHVAALRQGCADGIKIADAVLDETFGGTEKANSKPYPTLRDDFCAHKVDVVIVTAVNGAALLSKHIATHCPTGGTPLDNWRRSMNEVGKRAEGELPEDSGSDDANENDKSSEFFAAAVRAVRCAYADEICRLDVPSSALEVAALAHHLRRPITLIRGPCVTKKGNIRKPCDESSDDSPWRARCFSETFGERFRDDGREGFTLFWELAANVPCGLPAGDFSLLLPKVPEGTRRYPKRFPKLRLNNKPVCKQRVR